MPPISSALRMCIASTPTLCVRAISQGERATSRASPLTIAPINTRLISENADQKHDESECDQAIGKPSRKYVCQLRIGYCDDEHKQPEN